MTATYTHSELIQRLYEHIDTAAKSELTPIIQTAYEASPRHTGVLASYEPIVFYPETEGSPPQDGWWLKVIDNPPTGRQAAFGSCRIRFPDGVHTAKRYRNRGRIRVEINKPREWAQQGQLDAAADIILAALRRNVDGVVLFGAGREPAVAVSEEFRAVVSARYTYDTHSKIAS